jgi:hypothetical protein
MDPKKVREIGEWHIPKRSFEVNNFVVKLVSIESLLQISMVFVH